MSTSFWISYVLLWALVAFESLLVFALLREIGRLHLQNPATIQRDGLEVGATLPALHAVVTEQEVVLPDLLHAENNLVVSALPECRFCVDAAEVAIRWRDRNVGRLGAVVLLAAGELGKYEELASRIDIALVKPDEVVDALKIRVAPFAHVVARDGHVLAKGVLNTDDDLAQLLEAAGIEYEWPERSAAEAVATAVGGRSPADVVLTER